MRHDSRNLWRRTSILSQVFKKQGHSNRQAWLNVEGETYPRLLQEVGDIVVLETIPLPSIVAWLVATELLTP